MKNLCDPAIAKWRDHGADQLFGTADDERAFGGAFIVPYSRPGVIRNERLRVIASSGLGKPPGWQFDHVSVSLAHRCPDWEEMEFVKRLFFKPEEVAYQLHVAVADHVNAHPYCLHLWRCLDQPVPLPPAVMVGPRSPVR
jgi:hypothetical protein